MRWLLICAIIVIVGFMLYVRLIPSDTGKWHVAGRDLDIGDYATASGFTAVRAVTTSPEGVLTAIALAAEQTPRTVLIAGSVEDGMLTYMTRSKIMGFPDYTTISIIPTGAAPSDNPAPLLKVYGRLRFGSSDLGVNRARVEEWLSQLGPLIAAP